MLSLIEIVAIDLVTPWFFIASFLFGGFNSHAAHHLFPTLPHTIYPKITPIIVEKAKKYNYTYNVLSLLGAIKSHFKYLKKHGK